MQPFYPASFCQLIVKQEEHGRTAAAKSVREFYGQRAEKAGCPGSREIITAQRERKGLFRLMIDKGLQILFPAAPWLEAGFFRGEIF